MVEPGTKIDLTHSEPTPLETTVPAVSLKLFQAGYCLHPQGMVLSGASWRAAKFPATFALIEHPRLGKVLFDTGYAQRFFAETRPWPFRLYAWMTPVFLQPGESAADQLQAQGIAPAEIGTVIISHFHADHIGGLRDFPTAQFIYDRAAYEAVKHRQGVRALKAGFLAGLLPSDFTARSVWLETLKPVPLAPEYWPFEKGTDLLGDGSLIGVSLPGHATGQLGLLLKDLAGQAYFLIADACWLSQAYQDLIGPHPLTNLIQSDRGDYDRTLRKLHQLHRHHPTLKIIPAHCSEAWEQLGG